MQNRDIFYINEIFILFQDSAAALQALVQYSHRARLRDVTDMRVVIEHSANPNFSVDVSLGGQSMEFAAMRSYEVCFFLIAKSDQCLRLGYWI